MFTVNATQLSCSRANATRALRRGGASTTARRSVVVARAAGDTEEEMLKRYPLSADVYKVELDCSQSSIQLGIFLEKGPDDRPRVRTIRPGGTAKGKVEIGDVVLATTYTILTNVRDDAWGSARRGWVDTADTTSEQAEAAMTTNSTSLGMILSRNYKETGLKKANVDEDTAAWAARIAAEARAKRNQ
jgi:hypothetical protein